MLVIRLTKIGKKNAPSYRVVLIEKTASPQSGKFLEILGNYNPRLINKETGKKQISLDGERIKYWLSQGVKTSDTVHNLLIENKIIEGSKIKRKIKVKDKKESPEASSGSRPEGVGKEPKEEKVPMQDRDPDQSIGKKEEVDNSENKE